MQWFSKKIQLQVINSDKMRAYFFTLHKKKKEDSLAQVIYLFHSSQTVLRKLA